MATATALFLGQADRADRHAFVHGFAHIINCQSGNRNRRQSLHFDSGPAVDAHPGLDLHQRLLMIRGKINLDAVDQKGMAEGNQLGGLLCRHDPRNSRDREHIVQGLIKMGALNGVIWAVVVAALAIVWFGSNLILNQGVVYAATASGLARYGEPTSASPTVSLPNLRPLANPSGMQVLILILTVGLAGLVLLGRKEWVPGRSQALA